MNQFDNDRIINYGMFSPKIENSRHLNLNQKKKNFGNYSTYSKYTNSVLGSPINLYSKPKNISKHNCLSPNHSKVSTMLSPIHRNSNKLRKSSSQISMISRPKSSTSRGLPSVKNNSFIISPTNRRNNTRNINKKILYNLNENFSNKQNFFNFETEKLYQETHQIKKLAKLLTNELSVLKQENAEKDRLISIKEKQINDIIMNNNMTTFENVKNNTNSNEHNTSIISNNSNNNANYDTTVFNDSIYANALLSNRNTSMNNLFFKIKKEIKKTNNEIKLECDKFEKLKRSIFNTKVNELKIESNLLEEQINKINSLLVNALQVKEKNEKKTYEIAIIKENIEKQEKIINNLITITKKLEIEQNDLNIKLAENKNEFNSKMREVNKNNSKLDMLKKKNDNLSKDKTIKNEKYITKINGNPITFNSLYINKIAELKKTVKFYKKQVEYSDNEINKLKDKRKKLIDAEKIKSIKFDSNFLDKNVGTNINRTTNIKNIEDSFTMKGVQKLPEEEIISKLKNKLKDSKENEKILEEKMILYQNKLKEIDINQVDEKEEENESQVEFGIDSDNPYYIDDDKNIPEISNKFTSSQFNQFTYILFKNFESKGIVQDESKNKLINPLIEFANKNNISVVEYPSNAFDMVIEEFANIILNVLNVNNSNNHILIKIFISALFYNSRCNVNKFIEYFNILFSYTKNYILEEEKYKDKLKNKYIEQTKKLISCINTYINTEFNSSPYFPLLKMKELLDKNEINLKDKYIEFLFYYMKKFDDPESKLSDLKFSLLNNIISLNSNEIEKIENINNSNLNFNENEINEIIKEEDKINLSKKEESNIEQIEKKSSNKNNGISGIKSPTEEDFTNRQKKKIHTDKNEKENSDDYEDDEDSMTEITNEEYIKQLTEALSIMQKGLSDANINFSDLMSNVIQKRKITGVFYECITIEDFNDQLKSIKIVLSDLKLSCLCSKYSIPNELRLIDKNKIEKDIEDQSNGILKLEEEEENN